MKTSVVAIPGNKPGLAALALEVARSEFGSGEGSTKDSIENALKSPPATSPEILILADATADEIVAAVAARDELRLPRWGVVALGEGTPGGGAELVAPAEWNEAILRHALRAARAQLLLRRENERFRADLLSVGLRVAHDLRSPLGGVIAGAESIQEYLKRNAPDGLALAVPILESADDLVKIVGKLSLWAKATAIRPMRSRFEMSTAFDRAKTRFEVKMSGKKLSLVVPPTWPAATGDAARCEDIWSFLLDNAVRHAPTGTAIAVGWELVDREHIFWIHNSGGEVPPEKRSTLFQPFHRLHEPNAVRGLGLPIVERLASLQGGRCGYEPDAPGGARFFFSLPLA